MYSPPNATAQLFAEGATNGDI